MSILTEEIQVDSCLSPTEQRAKKYGGLSSNRRAKNRRDNLKFFDSADWAMRNQNPQNSPEQNKEDQLPSANSFNIPDADDDENNSNSVLTNDQCQISSPTENKNVFSYEAGDNQNSPICKTKQYENNLKRNIEYKNTESLTVCIDSNSLIIDEKIKSNDNFNDSPIKEQGMSEKKPKFGNLKSSTAARKRREGVKFFDSADWAMSGTNPNDSQENVSHKAQFSKILEDDHDDESPLTSFDSTFA